MPNKISIKLFKEANKERPLHPTATSATRRLWTRANARSTTRTDCGVRKSYIRTINS